MNTPYRPAGKPWPEQSGQAAAASDKTRAPASEETENVDHDGHAHRHDGDSRLDQGHSHGKGGGHGPGGHGPGEHGHGGHSHAMHAHGGSDSRRIGWAFLIIAVFMAVEIAGGVISGSLALLADAGHMVSDSVALGLSWLAIRLGRRPASATLSFGYQRFEILAAFVNGCALFVIAAWIVFEAVRRFFEPVAVVGTAMLAVAAVGLLANIVAFLVLNGGNRANLNMRSAWLHVLGDLLGSAVAIVAAVIILLTGWTAADPILSIVVAVIVLKSAWGIVRESAHILLEGTPTGFDAVALKDDLERALPEVADVHHVHAWSISGERRMVTLHVRPRPGHTGSAVLASVRHRLTERHGFDHVTIQVEDEACESPTTAACAGPATARPADEG